MFLDFHIQHIFIYILDVSQIFWDNHETTAIREATPKNDIQEHRNGKRTKYLEILSNYCKFSIKPSPGTQASSIITCLLFLMPLFTNSSN